MLSGSRIYVTGSASSDATFGGLSLTSGTTGNIGFLASLTDATLTATIPALIPLSIDLFPNPAHSRATVQLPSGAGPATLTLFDALGRTLRTQTSGRTRPDGPGARPLCRAGDRGRQHATRRLVVE